MTLGESPQTTLSAVRIKAVKASVDADAGKHLTQVKVAAKAATIARGLQTLGRVAQDWMHDERRRKGWSADYQVEVANSHKRHLSRLDPLLVADITAPLVAPILRNMEKEAAAMVEKIHRRLHGIMDYCIEQGLIAGNPLPRRRTTYTKRHYPAVTDLAGVGEILRAARAADPCKGIMRAHVVAAFTAMRVSEVVGATWAEFQLDGVDIVTDHDVRHDTAPAIRSSRARE